MSTYQHLISREINLFVLWLVIDVLLRPSPNFTSTSSTQFQWTVTLDPDLMCCCRDFNLDEKIEALPSLSLEEFQQKKKAKKKRVACSPGTPRKVAAAAAAARIIKEEPLGMKGAKDTLVLSHF